MTNISVIILVGKEELHIGRCLDRLMDLNPRQVLVVESQKGDRTHEIAIEHGATCMWHDWPGLQSTQFNWALDQLKDFSAANLKLHPQPSSWILRLDADEYIDDAGIAWLKGNLDKIPAEVSALELTLERKFCGGFIRHATNGIKMVRMFRFGKARYEETLMDERLIIDGVVQSVPVTFYDDNLNSMDWWREKHRGYAKREAEQALAGTFQDPRKAKYYKLPPYLRALIYFLIRYFLKGGFLDGKAGWMWNFWQGLWYRWIVDREIARLRRETKNALGYII